MSSTDHADDRDFLPTATWEMLQFRASVLRRLRQFFEDRRFIEVETPLLSADTVADSYIDPIPVTYFTDPREPGVGRTMWLQTSPEFCMKRLLAAGADRIYQVAKAFRAGEHGARHNPEFTIVEWYRVGDSMQDGMDLLADLARQLLGAEPIEKLSYEAAFLRHLGVNPHNTTARELADRARDLGLSPPAGLADDRDGWLNFLLATCVEPHLGDDRPTILYHYPASQAALANVCALQTGDHSSGLVDVAERFELYVRGVELANGSCELLDPVVLRERNRIANATRAADKRYTVPEESRVLSAMTSGLPTASGVALGFDRLVMLAASVNDLRQVIAFPIDRA